MDKMDWRKKIGVTPGKLLLVGVLGCVLVTVIRLQLGARETSGVSRSADRRVDRMRRRSSKASTERTGNHDVTAVTRTAQQWPEIPLKKVLAHDPFALPPALAPPAPAPTPKQAAEGRANRQQDIELARSRGQALAAVREQGIQMILVNPGDPVALVGDRPVRVGDVLEGFQVVAISADGITLSELPVELDSEEDGVATQ